MQLYTKLLSGVAAILLDLDGTLVDSNEAQARAWVDVFSDYGHRLDVISLRPLLGMETRALVAQAVGPVSEDMARHLDALRWRILQERYLHLVHPVEKASELLVLLKLRGLSTFLVSRAEPAERRALLARGGLLEHLRNDFQVPAGTSQVGLLLARLAGHELEPGQCLFIGDSVHDGQAAREAGMRFLAVEGKGGRIVGLGNGGPVAPSVGAIFRALSTESLSNSHRLFNRCSLAAQPETPLTLSASPTGTR